MSGMARHSTHSRGGDVFAWRGTWQTVPFAAPQQLSQPTLPGCSLITGERNQFERAGY